MKRQPEQLRLPLPAEVIDLDAHRGAHIILSARGERVIHPLMEQRPRRRPKR